ncbi:MAG: ribosome maturation factor RimM [Hyphomicrobiales bacterium]
MNASDIKRICLGQIGAANGIKGHVRVKPFTGEPEAFGDYGSLEDESGKNRFKIAALRPIKGGMLVVKFKGINDRNQAEALTGTKLYIDRDRLPDLDEDDDFYIEDLIGLQTVDTEGNSLGEVTLIHNFGAGDLLEIKPDHAPTVLVPFTKAAVPTVSLSEKKIVISLAEAGLDGDDDEPDDVS